MKSLQYFLSGFNLVLKPRVLPFVLIPLLINILLFSALIYYGWQQYQGLMTWLQAQLPDWLAWLEWLLLPLFIVTAFVAIFFTFTVVANFVAAPFNGVLAEVVEHVLTHDSLPPSSLLQTLKEVPATLAAELHKILYYLRWVIPLFLLGFIPVLNLIMPILWFIFGAWMMCLQYVDFPMGNHAINPVRQRELLGSRRFMSLSFGAIIMVSTMIPILNFFIMPIAVAAATQLWVTEFRAENRKPANNHG